MSPIPLGQTKNLQTMDNRPKEIDLSQPIHTFDVDSEVVGYYRSNNTDVSITVRDVKEYVPLWRISMRAGVAAVKELYENATY